MKCAMLFGALLCLAALPLAAQDPVKVDPKHYKVELENKQVRVLRINYGPREKWSCSGSLSGFWTST